MIGVGDDAKTDKLKSYRAKRDPKRTNEPFSPEPLVSTSDGQASGQTWAGAFVVHEHDASHRHFDLRLEVGGVLKSFAVPRGPTLDPEEKRLAIQTEDHPLPYLDYEGIIPEQNYGAGPMITWDLGTTRFLEQSAEVGLDKGKLDFELYGHKLRGRFALVRTSGRKGEVTKQPQWLLIKKRDGHEKPGTLIIDEAPESVLSGLCVGELAHAEQRALDVVGEADVLGAKVHVIDGRKLVPMACSTSGAALKARGTYYELKLDGVRIVAEKRGDEVTLHYRKGRSATASYPEVVRALRALPFERVILDGEILAFDARGKPDFQRLAQRFTVHKPRDVQRAMRIVPVNYVVFDLLQVGDRDLTSLPLSARKGLLKRVVPRRGLVRALDHIENDGEPLYAFCRTQRLEGIIAKRADAPYRVGPKPAREWVKIKCEREDDFVVVGYTRGKGGRVLGALDLASYEGDRLVSRGKVGSGFDDAMLTLLQKQLDAMRVQKTDVIGELVAAPQGRVFVRPDLVVNVRYLGFTDQGSQRHPGFCGLRADVSPRDCRAMPHDALEQLIVQVPREPEPVPRAPGKRRVQLTNSKKVFWPDDGLTKGDLCAYYEAIAPTILPFLRERPVILVRYPDGIAGKSFYQWNAPQGTPSWVRTVRVNWDDREGKDAELFLIDDLDTLLHVANLGCIPLHILAARIGSLSTCDFLTVDFDLGGQPLSHGITLARELHDVLEQIGLVGYPKTSGQTGLHVLVPLGPAISFDTARALCDLLGSIVTARHRELATQERTKERRGPKVYVDTGQTGTIRAIVAPYSVRAYPGARVSTPLIWDEVGFALDPARFTIQSVPDRVAEVGDPMAGLLAQSPDIPAAVGKLSAILPARRT